MKKIHNPELLDKYIQKYNLMSIFENNMLNYMNLFSLDKGENIIENSNEMMNMYFLVEGKLKIFTYFSDDKSLLLRFNKPLSILGDVELLTNYKVGANVEALNKVIIIGIKYEDIYKYAIDDPIFLRFVIKNLSQKLYTLSNFTSLNLLHPLENRLASYLISISFDENNTPTLHEIKTSNLTEIAMLLGTSYRHLLRTFKKFSQEGIVKKENKKITICDYDKLKALSKDTLYE